MKFKIPFSGRAHIYSEEELKTVVEAIQIAVPLTQGQYQEKFQQKFCQYIGSKHAFALNNATAGLELTAQLCQFKKGDEVIIPSHTYTSTAYPFLKKGAKIVWADINIKSRVVTSKTIEKCITKKTKAIVVVHLYGYCADMPAIMDIAKRYNLLVIEDVAQALGTRMNHQMAGTFGDFGVFSFHSHKNITTLGEGGMLVVKDSKIAKIIPMLRHNGHCAFEFEQENYWTPAMGNVDLPELNSEPIWPNNYCLGEVECALGVKLLDRLDNINSDKRNRALKFIDHVKEFPQLEFHREPSNRHNYHLLVAKVTNGKRDLFMRMMAKEGVQCVVQYYPLNRYDLYKKMGYGQADCPNTEEFFDNMVSFPFQSMLTDAEFVEMITITKRILAKF